MKNHAIRCYERELGNAVHGIRLRRKIKESFRRSLPLFLEDVEEPTYEELVQAFGPPEEMAHGLILSCTDIPKPLRHSHKLGIIAVIILVIAVVTSGMAARWMTPEKDVTLFEPHEYSDDELYSQYTFKLISQFTNDELAWEQPEEYPSYLVLAYNTNSVDTTIIVRYSKHISPYTFVVPAGKSKALLVEKPRSGEHLISFDTSNGSFSGVVQVLLPKVT